ncbi:hypothetical protein BJX64DRAFT_97742 [Aspergillus heterothallicus]
MLSAAVIHGLVISVYNSLPHVVFSTSSSRVINALTYMKQACPSSHCTVISNSCERIQLFSVPDSRYGHDPREIPVRCSVEPNLWIRTVRPQFVAILRVQTLWSPRINWKVVARLMPASRTFPGQGPHYLEYS